MQTSKPRIFPMLIVGLLGAVIGSFAMMLYASGRFAGPATADRAPSVVSAAPIVPAYVSDQERIVNAVKRVSPSVVALNITVNGERYVPVDPFAQMFGMQSPGRVQRFRARASGSGWVFGRDGYIVTNAHVVVPARGQGQVTKIEVLFPNGDRIPGHVYAANVGADLALVK